MKKLLTSMMALMALMLIAACSDSRPRLLDYIPADTDLVAVVDASTLARSAGFSTNQDGHTVIPAWLAGTLTPDQITELTEAGALRCIDSDAVVLAFNYGSGAPVVLMNVTDRPAFLSYLELKKYVLKAQRGHYTLYADDSGSHVVLTDDDVAFVCDRMPNQYVRPADTPVGGLSGRSLPAPQSPNMDQIALVDQMIQCAAANPVTKLAAADVFGQDGGHTLALMARMPRFLAALPEEYSGTTLVATAKLTDTELTADMRLVDERGQMVHLTSPVMEAPRPIDCELLRYADARESLIAAVNLHSLDWDKVLDAISSGMPRSDRAVLVVVRPFLEAIDGTVALAVGPANGLESVNQALYQANGMSIARALSFTFMAKLKDGRSEEYLTQLKGLAQLIDAPITDTADGFAVTVPDGTTLYVSNLHDNLIISSHMPKRSAANLPASLTALGGQWSAVALAMDKDDSLMRELFPGHKLTLLLSADTQSAVHLVYELTGGSAPGLIERTAMALKEADIRMRHD